MHPHTSPKIVVVKREDKGSKLEAFVRGYMERVLDTGLSAASTTCLLVARSAESPVVEALSAVTREIGRERIEMLAILALIGPNEAANFSREKALLHTCGVRWAHDIRLHDAHEQLVLGDEASWMGDSMRREPGKHDSYEWYAPNCPTAAHWARVAFERLWAASRPVSKPCTKAREPGWAR
jgi:hypothetical protein